MEAERWIIACFCISKPCGFAFVAGVGCWRLSRPLNSVTLPPLYLLYHSFVSSGPCLHTPLLLSTPPDTQLTPPVQFAEYIQANAQLYSMRNGIDLSPSAVANFVRGELASSLRSRKPYNVNLLLGGFDPITSRPSLYWLDYLASLAPLPYAAHGYAQYYCLSILDKHHHPDIDYEEGLKLLRLCTDELKRRLPIDFKGMLVKVITKDGIREVEYDDEARIACP